MTPNSAETHGLAVVEKSRETIVVKELMNGNGNFSFDYYVTAVRAGFEGHDPVVPNTHFRPGADETAEAFEARYAGDDMTSRAMRSMLMENGLLTGYGKLNMAMIEQLGWTVAKNRLTYESHVNAEEMRE